MSDDEEPTFNFIGGPAELMKAQMEAAEHRHMQVEEFKRSVDRFFEELTPEQAFTFHRMMLHAAHADDAGMLHYWAGVMSIYLKKVHKVCTACGNKSHADDEHFLAMAAADKDDEAKESAVLIQLPDESLSEHELLERYNLRLHKDPVIGDAVQCIGCDSVFSSIEFRQNQGRDCPACKALKGFNIQED